MRNINELLKKGIEDGRRAFIGPKTVQIDLTGRCNNNCIGCWVHSPFKKNPPPDKNLTLPFSDIKKLIKDLAHLRTEEIFLSGAGEPFLHPDIVEIVKLIKDNGLKVNIITNFTLIDTEKAKMLIDSGVDMITASIWAATPETYTKTHPSKTKEDFYKIKDNLKNLALLKAKENKYLPQVKIYNVLCNENYNEIQQMIDFALDTQVNFIEFQVMDIIENETSFLALSNEQVKHIKEQFYTLNERNDLYFKELELFNLKMSKEEELKEFPGRFLRLYPGFFLKEWTEQKDTSAKVALRSLICTKGVSTIPGRLNPLINEIERKVTFKFFIDKCHNCSLFKDSCPVDENGRINFNYLVILGFGSFMRRINSSNIYEQIYERDLIDNLPCYAGWIYSRVLSSGETIPCCKSALKSLGNIHKNTFSDIWASRNYREFRYNAKTLSKSNSYFKDIYCYKSCDNVGMNLQIKEVISSNNEGQDLNVQPPVRKEAEGVSRLPDAKVELIIPAAEFKSGNINMLEHEFGKGVVIDSGKGLSFAEYEINFAVSGIYELWAYYATEDPRPVEVYFDGNLVKKDALSSTTSGWTREDLLWFKETVVDVCEGKHTLKLFKTQGFIPHIHSFAFLKGIKYDKNKTKKCLSENIYQEPSSLRLLKDKFKTIGFVNSTLRLFNYILSGRLVKNYLDILGVFHGSYAFKGPFHVQIDLTNDCNNNCIGCWCNSPLLEEKALSPEKKRQFLPFPLVKELLEGLSQMGTKEIYFSGGGEPFIHPSIMEILAFAKKKNFICYVNTNFTLLDRPRITRLIDLGVDHLTVSTWTASPKTYAVTHPNKNEETFRQITENLKFLNKTKRKTPFIKLYNVIFNLNYHELREMIDFAQETGSESLEFTLIDTIPGKTDKLLLNPEQIRQLQDVTREIAKGVDNRGYFNRVLLFRFDSFQRRISSAFDLGKATYDRNIINRIPCYIGFCFSRIMPNGDVNACLKAHRIPTGNLYHASFSQVWNGENQRYFRKKTLVYEKRDDFFRLIGNDPQINEAGCYKSCDDIGRNVFLHNRIMSLTATERGFLKLIARTRRRPELNSTQKIIEDKIMAGVIDGRKAFVGPEQVVIDITNRCNERCIGCWLYSPLLKERPRGDCLKEEISFKKAKILIDQLSILGTKRIRFTGGGEPFMHPNIMELIEYIKSKGMICCITTNFSLLNKNKVAHLIRLGVDELAISLWASNKTAYQKTHPGTSTDTFERIKENLEALTHNKKDKPFVTLCNVICNLNYLEAEEMFRFALDMKADGIYFTLIDVLGGTETLLLNEEQKCIVLKQTESIQRTWQGLSESNKVKLDYFEGFVSRLKQRDSLIGEYDRHRINQIPCYVGWIFARILADGGVVPCCRGVNSLLGNINSNDFKDIWFSEKYNEFRTQAKYQSKDAAYFKDIGCIKMCDNLMHNEQMHKMVIQREG